MSLVKIRVKAGMNEVEIETPIDSLPQVIDAIPSILSSIQQHLYGEAQDMHGSRDPNLYQTSLGEDGSVRVQADTLHDMPEIRIEKGDSLSDIIVKAFRTDWGRQARRLADVKNMLEHYGLSYPKQSVAVTLLRLAQGGRLRRFKGSDGEFVYTASTELLAGVGDDGKGDHGSGSGV
ncbi:MAG: hypothetical protein RMJ59_07780 [Candidatus Nitrosocaldus sp.]|nr:hypothetical protein [Candidatus Nitrosocaldus sp.]MCS7141667.1 hypothetical protein [Candidatus Nitrosocaldus sp.]MDW8000686.1 hypothetical protein [Candidatus Nitrosocaldus sp.]MDW8276259.1 hypothetical protein [Candidatus Nitrosocaldus sp.]